VTTHRFSTFTDLLAYCENSANPVGHLVLYLFEKANPATFEASDKICTGLQLANFWQDVSADWDNGRLYLPLEDLERFGYTEAGFAERLVNDPFRRLMGFQVDRTRRLLRRGATLLGLVNGRLRLELALTVRGGLSILRRIEVIGYDVLHRRPVLSWVDKARIVYDAVLRRPLWKQPPQP
jgi:phytoene synthase